MENESAGAAQLLEGADPDDIKALFAMGHEVFYTAGDLIFDVGDEAEGLYLILDGEAQADTAGRFRRLTRGAIFGEIALLAQEPRLAAVWAIKPLHAVNVSGNDFRSFLLERPQIALSMLRSLAHRLLAFEQHAGDDWIASGVSHMDEYAMRRSDR